MELQAVGAVGQRELAQVYAVAAGLRAGCEFKHVGHGRLVASQEGCVVAVHVAVPRATGVVARLFEGGRQHEARAQTAQVAGLWLVGTLEVNRAVGIERVVVLYVTQRADIAYAHVCHAVAVDRR